MKTAIYHIRTRCNYSQSMAARELGVSRQMFSAWEHGDKPIPDIRKQTISALFGVPVSILEETDEAAVLAFCDRPMFSTTCQGKQVFSFLPPKKQTRVFLGVPTATRPEEQCKILMSQKAALLEKLDRLFQFDPQRQVDELPDMEWKLSVLSRFTSVADAAEAVAPPYRGRLLRFILEQMEILSAMLQGTQLPEQDTWAQQQLHLLRHRWGQINALPDDTSTDAPGHSKNCKPEEILQRIDYWYQKAKRRGADWAQLQWRLNQILEQENTHELD